MPLQGHLSVERICRIADVSRAGFYRYLRGRSRVEEEITIRSAVQDIVLEHRWRYGCRSCSSFEGSQIAGKRFSTSTFRIKSASRRSCFCFLGSAARISAGWPTRHSIPSSSMRFTNHCIDPVASMPTRTGRGSEE